MSIYIQEVLGLLKRNKKKIKLDKVRDHFEFGKLYQNSTLNTGAVYSPKMEPFVIKWGDLVCQATEDLTRTQPGSGNLGFVPVYTNPEGTCSWDTLKDSIITQNAIGDTISIGGNLIVNGTATVTSLTDNRIVIVGPGGLLEDDSNFTMDGVTFTALVNVQHGSVTASPAVPTTTTTLHSNIILNGPITDSQGNVGQLSQVLVGLADGRVIWANDDVVEALTYGSLWQGDVNNLKVELAVGTANQILIADGTTFAWQDNPAAIVGEVCDIYRIPLWTPDSNTLGCSLLIQDGNSGTPATQVKNDGILQNVGIVKLDSVAQDDTLIQVLVRDPAAANEVKFRDAATIIPTVGFDTLPMSPTLDWTQNFYNAFVNLTTSKVGFTVIKGMTNLTDGQQGEVIAENVLSGTLLTDDVIRFPDGWGPVGGLYNNRVTWTPGIDNGYPTSTLLFGESVKFKYITYAIPGGNSKMLYWDACCKVMSTNGCPVASNSVQTINEDTVLNNTVTVVDDGYGGYGLTYTAVTQPANGTLVFNVNTGAYTFTPDANWYGTTSFTYSATDGYCISNIATVTIIVLPIAEAPIWTSTDPVTANTYPNLTGGDTWTYNWTTNDPDHPCNLLTYTFASTPAAPWLTFVDNGDCTGTLSGTYPPTGGSYTVTLTVTDPDFLSDSQSFVIGGLAVTKDTYFVNWSDVSGSMNSTIKVTAQMSSIPKVFAKSNGPTNNNTFNFDVSQPDTQFVSNPNGTTKSAGLCVRVGMEVSGTGITAGTLVTAINLATNSCTLDSVNTSPNSSTTTFTMTEALYVADYADVTNFRNLYQDYYQTGGTESGVGNAGGVPNTNAATNGRDQYDSHIYWGHSGAERQIDMLGNRGQGGLATFSGAVNIVFMGWGDESSQYELTGSGSGSWADRQNSTVPEILTDVNSVKNYISTMETAAGNNSIYRGIFFKVNGSTPDLGPLLNNGGFVGTGGRTANGFSGSYLPEALAYNPTTQSLFPESSGAPTRITYSSNVTPGAAQSVFYNLVKAELIAIGYTTL